MAKAENKTRQTTVSPRDFIASLDAGPRKRDAERLLPLIEKVTGLKGYMWGPSIIGFGRYHYKYESGREGDMCMSGFSPRKANMVIYGLSGIANMDDKLARLGKHKTGKGCLYLGKLDDLDKDVLAALIREGVAHMRKTYKTSDH